MPDEEIRTEAVTDLKAVNNAHYAEVTPSWVNVERKKCDFHLHHSSTSFQVEQIIDI